MVLHPAASSSIFMRCLRRSEWAASSDGSAAFGCCGRQRCPTPFSSSSECSGRPRALLRHLLAPSGSEHAVPIGSPRAGLHVFAPHGAVSRFERFGLRPLAIPRSTCERLLDFLRHPDQSEAWTHHRHEQHATTDIPLDDGSTATCHSGSGLGGGGGGGALRWLDIELDELGFVDQVLADIVRLYGVEPSSLLLREMFVVQYSALSEDDSVPRHLRGASLSHAYSSQMHARDRLEPHRDSSWFSFVVALNDVGIDFDGGGTALRTAPPINVPCGGCLTFVGQQLHSAAPVTRGRRFCLTGFVDLRASVATRNACAAEMRRFDPGFVCSSCAEFRRPYLRANVRILEKRAHGKTGKALLELLAARRLRMLHVDLEELERGCRAYLAAAKLGMAPTPAVSAFIERVLERHAHAPCSGS